MWLLAEERVIYGLTNTVHLHRNVKQASRLMFRCSSAGLRSVGTHALLLGPVATSPVKASWQFKRLQIDLASPRTYTYVPGSIMST